MRDKKMKIQYFAIMFAATMFAALSASTTHGQASQAIQVEVPFAFTAYKKVLPAGSYRIESVSGTQVLWRIRGSRKKRSSFLLAKSVAGTSRGDLRVIFHRYGDKLFLKGFKTSSYEVSLPASRLERTLQMAKETFVPAEIMSLETIAVGSR
jgi:hypothetical protein